MEQVKAEFYDFDEYNEAIKDWYLDINLLSKHDFKVDINLIWNDSFSICREYLNGNIEYRGVGVAGSRIIAIPVVFDSTLFWFDKKVSGNNMLIFAKDNFFDALTYSYFDNYTITIDEDLLFKTINDLGYAHCLDVFDGKAKELIISKEFSRNMGILSSNLLNTPINDTKNQNIQIQNIIYFLLKYIEHTKNAKFIDPQKKVLALNNTIDLINAHPEQLFTIPDLCSIIGVSERTLEYAFKEKYKLTPIQYIKVIRLNNVKKELYKFKGNKINIGDIAGKFNFWHMGQFAKDFKKQFGILPSDV